MKFAKKICILCCKNFIPKRLVFLKTSPLGTIFGEVQVGEAMLAEEPLGNGGNCLASVVKLHKLSDACSNLAPHNKTKSGLQATIFSSDAYM